MREETPKIEIEDELHRFMQLHGFCTLDQIKTLPFEELVKMDGFGWRILRHLYRIN